MNHGLHITNGMVMNLKKKNKLLFYGILFFLFFLLSYLFPYSHDDWAWGSSYGLERLETYFKGYNGRWMGNLVVLALTRSNFLKTLVMSLSLTFLLFCVSELTNKKKTYLLPFLLLLSTPILIFREAIVWTAGFSNYVVSMVFVFLFIYMNKDIFANEAKDTWGRRLLFPILSFISVLFVEHVTLYVLVLALFSIFYHFIQYKKINWSFVLYFVGSVLGTILMFSNSAYSNISSGTDTYRSIGLSSFLTSSITSYFTTIYKYLSAENYVLNVVLSGLVLLSLYRYLKKEKKHEKIIYILSTILVVYPIYNLVLRYSGISLFLKYTKYISGLFTVIYCLSILTSVFFIKEKEKRNKLLFALISIITLTAPLFVVTPIGGRCFFPIYLFWIWIVFLFYENVVQRESGYIKVLLTSLLALFSIYLFCIYGYIFKVNSARKKEIEEHKTEEILILPKLPYAKYMWCPDPVNEEFLNRFKSFYGIDSTTEVKFVSYKEWRKKR